ncbi:S8 family serine peptidase [Kroppenstedtia eburnea]|uniref:PA domain-containing protein n=1 Tax=Kroppenstedtia eburnea TaxID=714067 RepID=A0A1N7Q786_9BACL|nr:S8 family serine peptidase [Kroppenstedtia eburnea]QKI83195.1 S8 family serine peptidase [Kroppenstedtia eburnea]SIT18437.1 PA domain-containing protein [Kroppenstedtia eburnea]
MNKVSRGWMLALLLVLALSITALPVQAQIDTDGKAAPTKSEGDYYFVELENDPVATYEGDVKGYKATQVEGQKKLEMKNNDVQRYQSYLSKKRSSYKSWLKEKSSKAKVVEEYSVTLNGVAVKAEGINPDILRKGPGVKKVVKSLKYKPAMSTSHSIINDKPLWNMGYQGDRIKVAVIDSGIDQDHPFFQDPNLRMPVGFPKGDQRFTSNKVIVAKVFSPDAKATPEAIGSHGTHVAGTIAGVEGYKDPTGAAKNPLSGVAPKAYLGNYNVFPCNDCSAESIHIAAAVEAAVRDGMDVANLSLGGEAEPGFDLLAEIVNAASDAGMTTVISAGNEGPGPMTIGSPGTADKVITVAAVANSHFIGQVINITVNGEQKALPVATSDPGGQLTEKTEGSLAVVKDDNGLACSGISEDLTGKIAVIKRGDCSFTDKAFNAQQKGAAGVIIANNVPGDPSGMSLEEKVTIPAVMVSQPDGEWIMKGSEGSAVLDPAGLEEFDSENGKTLAAFSSRGPTINYTLKPDVAAVGVNVYSSVVGGGLASMNGTSMSAPHVAGAVALLKHARPDWTSQEIKAALIGTGTDIKGGPTLPLEVGGGVIDVANALNTPAMSSPASLSFGLVKKGDKKKIEVTLKNTSNAKKLKYKLSGDKDVDLSKKSLNLKKGESGKFTVTVEGKGKADTDYQGYINIKADNGKSIRIPYHFRTVNR